MTDMNGTASSNYSSRVSLSLHALGQTFPLSKIGPGYVVPTTPLDLPPCPAQVVMTVDEQPRCWDVRLVDGAVPYDEQVRFLELPRVPS